MNPPVTICLALYNGAAHLAAQLESIAAQHGADWQLIVSDDGSQDAGPEIVQDFAARHPGRVRLVQGPMKGAAQNFISLLVQAPQDTPLAFCDQDDVWLPHRIAVGLAGLDAAGSGPVIHCASTMVCDAALNPLFPSPLPRRALGLRHALVQAGGPGNTMLISPEALALLQQAAPAAIIAAVPAHDWWAYLLIVAAGGRMIRSAEQVLLYRQHEKNLVGRNDTLRGRMKRARQLFQGIYGQWLDANLAALGGAGTLVPASTQTLAHDLRASLRRNGLHTARALIRAGVYRQSRAGTAALLGAAAGGALRLRD